PARAVGAGADARMAGDRWAGWLRFGHGSGAEHAPLPRPARRAARAAAGPPCAAGQARRSRGRSGGALRPGDERVSRWNNPSARLRASAQLPARRWPAGMALCGRAADTREASVDGAWLANGLRRLHVAW